MEVTISANIADMVTMSSNGQSRVGSIVSSSVNSGIDSGSSRSTSGLTMVECQNITNNNCIQSRSASNNNGDNISWPTVPQDPSKMNKLREVVENSASVASKCMVDTLLQQVNQLSDLDKFLLYLKLPVGRTPDLDPLKQPLNPLGSRSEIQLTITWMKTHLEIDLEVSLPKEEVYNEYMHYCNSNGFKALSTADFGKVMKQVFPSVRARRLGHRGASKYCHSGLRKKFVLDVPALPDLSAESSSNGSNYGDKNGSNAEFSSDEVDKAAGSIIFEWAEKKFNVKADNYKDLALQLIEKSLVDPRSVAAYTLLSIDQRTGGGKHRETQYQLQKKLQEREHIREQKRKLQEQQPGLTKSCSERPKTRRRSGSIRNASGDSSSGSTSSMNSYANSKTTVGSSSISDVKSNYNLSNRYDIETNNNKLISDGKINIKTATNACSSAIIKQEDNSTSVSQHKNVFADNKDFSICNINNMNNNNNSTNGGINNSNQKLMRAISLDSNVGLSSMTKTPSPKTYLVMSNIDPNNASNNNINSSKSRYCPIQPKGNGSENLNTLNNNNNVADKGIPINNLNNLHQWSETPSNPNCLEISSSDILQTNIAVSNETDELQKKSQISELRKLLEKNLNSNSIPTCSSISRTLNDDNPHVDIDHEMMITTCNKRRVSFQPSVDSNDNLSRLSSMGCSTVGHVPPSPTLGNKSFNFTPINNSVTLNASQGPSQTSSANASPFVSPRSTPLHRSRHNSGQTSSTYVTPRSTPYTPDLAFPNNIHSESNSPFMSPAATPLLNRTRHNSSQSFRPSTAAGRPRHHSGNPSFRRTPYEDACNRRTKCRSRHDSGSIPLSPHSAPLSPLMHDSSVHTSVESNIFHSHIQQPVSSSNSSLQNVLLKQQQQSTYIGCDLRRRHMSAGPYPPQTIPISYPLNQTINVGYNNDHLGQEVSNVMNSSQPGPSNLTDNSNRAQSVPLLQMLNTACGSETDGMAKSHPNTPLINNTQFWYNTPSSDCFVSHPSSYAPTPVPSEYDDFGDYSTLGCDNELGIGPGSEDSGVNSFEEIYSNMGLPSSSDFSSVIDPSIRNEEVSSSMQTLLTSTTTYSLLSENKSAKDESSFSIGNQSNAKHENPQTSQASIQFGDASLLTLNAINNTLTNVLGNSEATFDPPSSVVDDFQNYNPFIEDAQDFSREFNPNSQEFMIPHQELLSRLEDG